MGSGVREPGTRVGAIFGVDKEDRTRLQVFGFGVYEGNLVPPRPIGMQAGLAPEESRGSWEDWWEWYRKDAPPGVTLEQVQLRNPCITLDSGARVWGCECWWGGEEAVRRRIEASGLEVVEVDPRTVPGLFAYEGR